MLHSAVAALDWDTTTEAPEATLRWLRLLAAQRASALEVRRHPPHRAWLRGALQVSCPLARPGVVVPDIATTLWWAAQVAAGVLLPGEAERVTNHLLMLLGPQRLARVRRVVRAACAPQPVTLDTALRWAQELSAELDIQGDEGAAGEPTDGRSGAEPPDPADVAASVREVARTSQALLAPPPADRELAHQREEQAALREFARQAAHRVFDRPRRRDEPSHTPAPELRSRARGLAAALRAARSRDPERTWLPAPVPPGRERMAELMRRDAQIAARTPVTATPWRQLRRRIVPEPELRVALSWDISASRVDMHAEMCELAWAVAWAARRADGHVAAVAWNDRPLPVIWPGRVPDEVPEPACGGRSAGCPDSLRALDGALGLSEARGARLLLVASDGRLPNRRHVDTEVARLAECGVQVTWLIPAEHAWVPASATPALTRPGTALTDLTDRLGRALQAA